MISPLRLLLHALGSLVLALAVLTVPSPAGAAITRLCTGYTSCANAGMGSAGYAQASGQMYWRMYSGHNCTNYAAYRVIKNGYSSTRPWDGSGNATYWGTADVEHHRPDPRRGRHRLVARRGLPGGLGRARGLRREGHQPHRDHHLAGQLGR